MTTALWLLFALGLIGAFDTLYYAALELPHGNFPWPKIKHRS